MAQCSCGDDNLVISTSLTKQTTYCQGCGAETVTEIKGHTNVSSITMKRADILKKLNGQKTKELKKPKQIRDRTDYTRARRAR